MHAAADVRSRMRRRLIQMASATVLPAGATSASRHPVTVVTFGDSILDCGHYNAHGVHPGQLLVRNEDQLFPEFRGRDLQSRGPARLLHHAVDGATVAGLAAQLARLDSQPDDGRGRVLQGSERRLALLTVGGNDLIRGLAADRGAAMLEFEKTLQSFINRLTIRPVLVGTVYDPTFGDDERNFLGVPARLARANHRRVNNILRAVGERHGRVADIHAHFLGGKSGWYTGVIEPSLVGASEVRRVFLSLL